MANSITDSIIKGCANIGMSRVMIDDAVAIIGSLHEVIPWEDDVKPAPSGEVGFLLRYEDICHSSSIHYMRNLSYLEGLDADIKQFWDKHNIEVINYSQGDGHSAAKMIEQVTDSVSRGGKPLYSSKEVDNALALYANEAATPAMIDIRKCAIACVLDNICRAYKQMNG